MTIKRISGWQVEKRVPLTLVFALLMQLAVLVVWATQLEARVNAFENSAIQMQQVAERLARLEERISALRDDMADIKRLLRQR